MTDHSERLLDHFDRPANVGTLDRERPDVGTGTVGSPECGDVLRIQIQVDAAGQVREARFKAFGSAATIAAGSFATMWLQGRSLDVVGGLSNTRISEALGIPRASKQAAVFAEKALRAAVEDYRRKGPASERRAGA